MRSSVSAAALCVALSTVFAAAAQTPPAEAPRIDYPNVAAALRDLESRDGNGTVVTHGDGWTTVTEPLAAAQWSFTPSTHHAYPAVVRRVIKRSPSGEVSLETTSLCEAPKAECDKLLVEFASMNDRIVQSVRSRGRPAPSVPPVPQ